MIGLDSCAIIDFADGNESLKKFLDEIKEPLAVNQISYLEIMFGLDLDNENYKMEEDFYDNFFQSISNLELDNAASKKASHIFWDLRKKGKSIEEFDCIIAGIYLSNSIDKIITKNAKHFSKIKGLKVLNY